MLRMLSATALLACTGPALALVINANDYAVGSDVSNAVPGMTLSWETLEPWDDAVLTSPVTVQESGCAPLCPAHSLGGRSWGLLSLEQVHDPELALDDLLSWSALRIDLDTPATGLQMTGSTEVATSFALFLDADGTPIDMPLLNHGEEVGEPGSPLGSYLPLDGDFLLDTPFTTAYIGGLIDPLWTHSISIFGSAANTNADANSPVAVPAPHAAALMALGLFAVGVVRSGRQRRRAR